MKKEGDGQLMDLSKSAENTLLLYANACQYHGKNYHFRSLEQTLEVKRRVYGIVRCLRTLNRENRKFREDGLIVKWGRTSLSEGRGRQFTSSITHLTWSGVYYLVRRRLVPANFIRVWERLSKYVKARGPVAKEVERIEKAGMSYDEWRTGVRRVAQKRGERLKFLGVPMRKGIMSLVPPDEEIRIKPYVRKKNT